MPPKIFKYKDPHSKAIDVAELPRKRIHLSHRLIPWAASLLGRSEGRANKARAHPNAKDIYQTRGTSVILTTPRVLKSMTFEA